MANLNAETVEANTSSASKEEIADCAQLVSTKMLFSSSRFSVEQASESMVKSEISMDTRGNGSFEVEMRKTMVHDSQHTTESSCSNSLRSPEEPVTASSESGVSAVRNATAKNGVKVLSMESIINKGDAEISYSWEDPQVLNKTVGKEKDEFWVVESADSSTMKRCKRTAKDQDKVIAGFDLNEDINANGGNDCVHSVIHVVAKAGIPLGQPLKPLKFEGKLGWICTSETSAFRATYHKPRFTGIDLNVGVVEEATATATDDGVSSHSEISAKRAKIPWIDLNSLHDETIPPKLETTPLADLNLGTNESRSNMISDNPNPRTRDFSLRSNVYMASPHILESMEPTQSRRVASHALPPHNYPIKGPFPFVSKDPLPYTRYYQENGILREPLKPGLFLHEQSSSSNASAFVPKHEEAKAEEFFPTSGKKSRKFPFLSRDF